MSLDVAGLRERLRRTPPAFAVYGDDFAGREEAGLTAAAVLVPIVLRQPEMTVIFTQRTTHLRAHSGQVAFPGGRAEPHDPTPEFTALREAQEEIGVPMEQVEVLARLPDYLTRTGFRVTPVVGLLQPPFPLQPDPREVQDVFEVPLSFLLDPRNHQRRMRELQGREVGYYAMEYGGRTIWGATAGMVVILCRHLAD
jgi:8-oxo-dGTP pyrophosphatase MutT (NUDIX family)